MISLELGVWVTAILMLFVFSVMWKDNPLFSFAEHVYVGLSAGYVIVIAVRTLQSMAIAPMMNGQILWGGVIVFGLLIYVRFWKKYQWISRWPVALLVGIGTAVVITTMVDAQVIQQILGSTLPLLAPTALTTINNWILVGGTIVTLLYFLFTMKTVQESKAFKRVSTSGRYLMMIGLGAAFGGVFLSYLGLLVVQVFYLLSTWLGLV